MSDRNGCVQFLDSMCPFFDNMNRYTTLIWDSNKKTLLGKNGVSWLSIFLGTLVVILGLSVFVQCVREVKKSRQESDTQMRKLLLEKMHLSAVHVGISAVQNVTQYPEIMSNSIIPPVLHNVSIDIPSSDETDGFEFLKERGLLVRKKRNFPIIHGIIRTPSCYKTIIVGPIVKEPNNTLILTRSELTERTERPKIDSKQKDTFLGKLASARYERLNRQSTISDNLDNVFNKSTDKTDSTIQNRKYPRFTRLCDLFRKSVSNDSVFQLIKSISKASSRKLPIDVVTENEENTKIIPNFEGKYETLKKEFLKSNSLSKYLEKKRKLSKLISKFALYRKAVYRSSNTDKYTTETKPFTEQNKNFEQDHKQYFASTNNKNDNLKSNKENPFKTLDEINYSKYVMNEDENSGTLIRRRRV